MNDPQIKRRKILQMLGYGASATALPSASLLAQANPSAGFKFGVQLSTITSLMMRDFEGSLAKAAEIGYDQVEFSARGFLGRPPEEVKALLEKYQLDAPVARVTPNYPANYFTLPASERIAAGRPFSGIENLLKNVEYALSVAKYMGQEYLNLPIAPREEFASRRQVENLIRLFNEAGAMCKEQGVLFGYHNHNFEFVEVDGIHPYDLMLAETDPELVSFQFDTYWVRRGGGDLIDYMQKYPGRFPSVHLKDINNEGGFEDVGYGTINFPEFIAAALENGSKYFFVERDGPPEPVQAIQRSYDYLSRLAI